ncbi:MAG: hypothetical protein AAGC68_05705 [Verrucomicrobiota bacterium]
MSNRALILVSAIALSLIGLAVVEISRIGAAWGKGGGEQSDAKERPVPTRLLDVPLTPTATFNVSERREDGINVISQTRAVAERLHLPDSGPIDDLSALGEIVRFHLDAFNSVPPGGENADIMRALTGANRRQIALIAPEHPDLNEAGELLDRWGTPYHFHQLSRTILEIRSAGPDRALWTEDDLFLGGTEHSGGS